MHGRGNHPAPSACTARSLLRLPWTTKSWCPRRLGFSRSTETSPGRPSYSFSFSSLPVLIHPSIHDPIPSSEIRKGRGGRYLNQNPGPPHPLRKRTRHISRRLRRGAPKKNIIHPATTHPRLRTTRLRIKYVYIKQPGQVPTSPPPLLQFPSSSNKLRGDRAAQEKERQCRAGRERNRAREYPTSRLRPSYQGSS